MDGAASNLFAAMAADGLNAAQVQAQITRALQGWAAPAALNFSFVADSGAPAGAAGLAAGDARFGDIRVFGRLLGAGVMAITTPPSEMTETRAGDIVINTSHHFSVGAKAGA